MQQEFTLEKTYEVTTTIKIVKNNDKYYAKVHRNFDDLWQEDDEYECWIENDGQLMTEPVATDKEYDAIIETFCSYIKENGIKYARCCNRCDKGMNEGYFANYEYFCSDECLHTQYTAKEWEELASDGVEDEEGNDCYYWTEWEDECTYVLFNNQLINI